jgi:hypothetical protein
MVMRLTAIVCLCWFIPFMSAKGEYYSPANWIWRTLTSSDVTSHELAVLLPLPIILLTFIFALGSLFIGWLVQCMVVVIRTKKV